MLKGCDMVLVMQSCLVAVLLTSLVVVILNDSAQEVSVPDTFCVEPIKG